MKTCVFSKSGISSVILVLSLLITFSAIAEKITQGSVITIEAEDVSNTNVFISKPKISADYVDPVKGKNKTVKLKILNKINKKNHPSSIDVEWKKNVKLNDLKKFSNTKTTFKNLENSPNKIVDCQMDFNGVSNKTLYILPPEISGIYDNSGTTIVSVAEAGIKIVIKGLYFGVKTPKVFLEYADSKDKVKRVKCKVDKSAFIYKNAKGKLSPMSAYTGESQLTVEMPKKFPWGTDTKNHNIVLQNKLGVATVIFSIGKEKENLEELIIPDGFNYGMTKNIGGTTDNQNFNSLNTLNNPIQLYLKAQNGVPIPNARVNIYNSSNFIKTVTTDSKGMYEINVNIPDALSELNINYNYVGAINGVQLDLQTGETLPTEAPEPNATDSSNTSANVSNLSAMYYMGTYDQNGVPNYLTTSDALDANWLAAINFSLPELKPVPIFHPEYLASGVDANTILISNADVWITFVHEGAGFRNTLGYFTYDVLNPPTQIGDIVSNIVLFPNLSYPYLKSGNKIYLGNFPKGTAIGYFLISNGWNGYNVGNGYQSIFSIPDLNTESTPEKRKHVVLLWNKEKKVQLLGIEDLNRNWGSSDDDFNDAVFYITVQPESAVTTDALPDMDLPIDTDGDGVFDNFDSYTNDPERAFINYYPNETDYETLAFEDNWPKKGDYDMNDLVIQYNFRYVTDADGKIKDIYPKFKILAVGAGNYNGFGFELGTTPDNIISNINNLSISNNYISLNANNTEAGQNKATVIVFDSVYDLISPPPGFVFVNTEVLAPYIQPAKIDFEIHFGNAVSKTDLGLPPYNPFMIANFKNKGRTNEIHLSGFKPTSLAMNIGITNLFGTKDDDSSVSAGKYYLTDKNLPWALNIPSDWDHDYEGKNILKSYLKFGTWAESNGESYKDWYMHKPGYRNEALIYQKP